jgi:hypothetical protein
LTTSTLPFIGQCLFLATGVRQRHSRQRLATARIRIEARAAAEIPTSGHRDEAYKGEQEPSGAGVF